MDDTVRGHGVAVDETLPSEPHKPIAATVDAGFYEITSEIGRGGMGRVVAATDRRLDRVVAVKLLQTDNPAVADRFRREARLTARLQHPSIVPVYEAGKLSNGEPFYAMKLVAGRSLDKLMERDRLALLPNLLAVADALAYAHDRGIIHRDLKPQNVIVGDFGETIVIDWGLAKDLNDTAPELSGTRGTSDASLTADGSVMGTPKYMAPEQAAGAQVDQRADVYSLGAMLYHLLSGDPPHAGTTLDEVLKSAISGSVPSLRERDDIPPDLAAIVHKALAREPADRYRDARELADDLRRYQTGQLVSPGVYWYSVGERFRRWIRRHRAVTTVAAIAIVVLAVGGGVSIREILAERDRADHEAEQARELARFNNNLAEQRESARKQEREQRETAENQTQLSRRIIGSQLQQHQAICRMAGEVAAARTAAEARQAMRDVTAQADAIAGRELLHEIEELDRLVVSWEHGVAPKGDTLGQQALRIPEMARKAWERTVMVTTADGGRLVDRMQRTPQDLSPLVTSIEREQLVAPLLKRARAAAAGLLDSDPARRESATREFWRLYWGELYFIENERLGGIPVEQAMVRIGWVLTGKEPATTLSDRIADLDRAAAKMLTP